MADCLGLSAVVVNWNSGSCLEKLLESLEPLRSGMGQVVVVDNASQDGSAGPARGRDGVELVEAGENLGFAGAANLGIARVSTPWILLLNPDVTLHPESVETLCHEVEERPRCGIATGTLLSRSPRTPQIRPLPGPWSMLRDAVFLDELLALAGLNRSADFLGEGSSGQAVRVEQPAAAFWMLRRRAWEAIGGFDRRFHPAWFEDVDFCRRLLDAGWEILHFPQIRVGTHLGGSSLDRLGYAAFVEIYTRNMLRYLAKHHTLAYPLLRPLIRLGALVRRGVIGRWR
jgi:GT2 family glycosyltransferase